MFIGLMLIILGGALTITGVGIIPGIIMVIIGWNFMKKSDKGASTQSTSTTSAPAENKTTAAKTEQPKAAASGPAPARTVEAEPRKADRPAAVGSKKASSAGPAAETAKPANDGRKRCGYCGAEVKEGDLFCSECGSMI